MDTEKTYSGLADGCAKAGKAGCKLIEFTGDNISGDDVKALLDYTHNVTNSLLALGNSTDLLPTLGGPQAVSRWLSGSHYPRLREEYGF